MSSRRLTTPHVTAIKIDPYLNVDAGTMAPTEYISVIHLLRLSPDPICKILGTAKSLSSMMVERWISI